MMKKFVMAATLLVSSSMAMAQAYVGGTVGYGSHGNVDCEGAAQCSRSSAIGKIFGGYAFNENFAVEVSYADLGSAKASTGPYEAKLKSSAFGVRAVGSYPLSKDFSVFAAAGLNYGKSKGTATDEESLSQSSTAPSLALGLDYSLTQSLKLRGEIETVRFNASGGHYSVTGLSAGLKYAF